MTRQLPPLNSLRAFEATVRLGNYRLVAEELHVTASAVSHTILTLEEWLGVKLFDRVPRGLVPTAAANALLPNVLRALALISDATDQIAGSRADGHLSLSAESTFANRWLVPRLPRFTERYPGISISMETLGPESANLANGIDLQIRYSQRAPGGVCRTKLVRDTLVPVAAPALLRTLASGDQVELLRKLPLLRVNSVSEDWDYWQSAAGITVAAKPEDIRFGTPHMALEAAVEGLGVAIGRHFLVERDLESGKLAELTLPRIAALSCYWLTGGGPTLERRESRAFRRWIVDEIRTSTAAPSCR